MKSMWRDKSPGLKILWLWTFGTAAVLVASVVTTRMRDMEQLVNKPQDQTPHAAAAELTAEHNE
ncbi:uncharacterized protein LOC127243722 [Andrographis paniculata]|uniref:uncharacterized protein LOC127243722 n=1 Tax=Andrographis paniculata TaxID=175694 RepID=UPI0021E97234|nr:uncharacterized protein LOC127243722 [Andrographis paniculata]